MRRSPTRLGLAVVAAALVAGLPVAGSASARTLEPIDPAAAPPGGPATIAYRDRVIDRPTARAAAFTLRATAHRYRVPDGRIVEVALSSSFADTPQNQAGAQSFVDFLGSRLHGRELSLLRVFIGTNAEINAACGGDTGVLACYSRFERRMYVPDRDPPGGGPFTRDYAVTHEYGHHIAGARSNYPFSALSYGTKYWASYEYVCHNTERRRLFPGDQGAHYLQDPGEGFADAYAHLHYPAAPWQFTPILLPNPGSFAAIRRDVLTPWVRQVRVPLRGFLGRVRHARSFVQPVSLDGILQLRLYGPYRSNYDLEVYSRGRLVTRSRAAGSRDRLSVVICRSGIPRIRPVVRVVRRSGGGGFLVVSAQPD